VKYTTRVIGRTCIGKQRAGQGHGYEQNGFLQLVRKTLRTVVRAWKGTALFLDPSGQTFGWPVAVCYPAAEEAEAYIPYRTRQKVSRRYYFGLKPIRCVLEA